MEDSNTGRTEMRTCDVIEPPQTNDQTLLGQFEKNFPLHVDAEHRCFYFANDPA